MADSYIPPDSELEPDDLDDRLGDRPSRPAGLMDSAKRMLATIIALVHTRLELFTTEIEEEIHRAASILIWALVALFFGSLTVLMLAFTVIIVFWDTNRVLAAVLVTATFLLATVGFGLLARARLKAKTRFMAASIEELKRDRGIARSDDVMSDRFEELQMRRRALLLRSERLRTELAAEQQVMLDALSGVDRAIATARKLGPPLLLAGVGAVLLRLFRRSRPAAGAGGLAMKALFWVSVAKRALPFVQLARNLWRSRSASRAAEASAVPGVAGEPF